MYLGHVEAHQLHTQRERELPRHLGLADAGGTGEQEQADRLALVAQPERDILIAAESVSIARSWP